MFHLNNFIATRTERLMVEMFFEIVYTESPLVTNAEQDDVFLFQPSVAKCFHNLYLTVDEESLLMNLVMHFSLTFSKRGNTFL
jgi:hypothetical protein